MKTWIAATTIALALISATVTSDAYADGRRDRHERHHDHGHRHKHKHHHHWNHRDSYRAGYVHGRIDQRRYDRGRYVHPRGYAHRAWRRGDHLPRAYYARPYVVHDYHVYHLHAPPRGYHWVRVDNDVVLAAVASGLVVQAVYGIFY